MMWIFAVVIINEVDMVRLRNAVGISQCNLKLPFFLATFLVFLFFFVHFSFLFYILLILVQLHSVPPLSNALLTLLAILLDLFFRKKSSNPSYPLNILHSSANFISSSASSLPLTLVPLSPPIQALSDLFQT